MYRDTTNELYHYGVKGMRWRHRKGIADQIEGQARARARTQKLQDRWDRLTGKKVGRSASGSAQSAGNKKFGNRINRRTKIEFAVGAAAHKGSQAFKKYWPKVKKTSVKTARASRKKYASITRNNTALVRNSQNYTRSTNAAIKSGAKKAAKKFNEYTVKRNY